MAKFAIGDKVNKATDDHEDGVVVAVFSTDDGKFRYAVDMEGYGALQFLAEEKFRSPLPISYAASCSCAIYPAMRRTLVVHPCQSATPRVA